MRRFVAPLLLSMAASVSPLAAQEDLPALLAERSKAIPQGQRTFQETWLLPVEGRPGDDPEAIDFAGRVHVYQKAPRERLEIHEVEDGELGEPVVIVFDGDRYMLVTRVGATPFLESDRANDSFVRLVLAGPPGSAPPHRTVAEVGGGGAVVLRHSLSDQFDPQKAFALTPVRGGRDLLSGVSRFSAAGESQVVASAGPRGVDQIRTANGTITVTPDPEAVEWMEEEIALPIVELERFRREARLPPYDELPAPVDEPAVAGGAR